MSTTIHNGTRPVTILNARERVTGRRGNWSIARAGMAPIVGIASKRVALGTAASIARAERTAARNMARSHARLQTLSPADQAVLLVACQDQGETLTAIFAQLDAAMAGPSAASANIRALARKLTADRVDATVAAARETLAEIEAHAAEQAGDDAVDQAQRAACQREADAYAARAEVPAVVSADGTIARIDARPAPTTGTADDHHRPLPRPASSRFIGDDARNGLEAECWTCGGRIIAHPSDATYRHLYDAVERAHGEALRLDVQTVMDTAWTRLTTPIETAHGEAIAEDRARTAVAGRSPGMVIVVPADVVNRGDQLPTGTPEHGSVTITVGGNDRAGIPAIRYPSGAVHRVQGGEITHRVTKSTAATFQPVADVAGLDAHAANERTVALIVQMRTTSHQATERPDRITCECGITATDRDGLARRHARSPAVLPGVSEVERADAIDAERAGGAR